MTRGQPGLLYVVSGASGTGKTSLCKALREKDPRLYFSVSYTTRPPRKGEKGGRDYCFVSPETFRAMINNNEFVEWAEIYGHRYGTAFSSIEKTVARGLDLLLDVDSQGAQRLKEKYPEGVSIFILPPSFEELEARLRKRNTDAPEIIEKRINRARQEIAQAIKYDYIVVNETFGETVRVLHGISLAERYRAKRMERNVSVLRSCSQ